MILGKRFLGVAYPLDGTHFSKNILISGQASKPQSRHAQRMSCLDCDLSELLEQTRPPDTELVDLIELAFLGGQIDGQKADLAYLWLMGKILTQKRAQTSITLSLAIY